MRHAVLWALPALILWAEPGTGLAQDATAVDPDHYAVLLENDAVRVLKISYGPDEISVMHEHPEAVAIPLTAGSIRMHMPDGSEVDMALEAGTPVWDSATRHQPHNIGTADFEAILVELKPAGEGEADPHAGHE